MVKPGRFRSYALWQATPPQYGHGWGFETCIIQLPHIWGQPRCQIPVISQWSAHGCVVNLRSHFLPLAYSRVGTVFRSVVGASCTAALTLPSSLLVSAQNELGTSGICSSSCKTEGTNRSVCWLFIHPCPIRLQPLIKVLNSWSATHGRTIS